jgi:hypothetical protein
MAGGHRETPELPGVSIGDANVLAFEGALYVIEDTVAGVDSMFLGLAAL